MLNVRDIHQEYSSVLESQILIWKRSRTPSRLKLASRILFRLVTKSSLIQVRIKIGQKELIFSLCSLVQ